MSGTRSVVGGFLVVSLALTMVNSKLELDSPLRLAHCRATCLYKLQMPELTDAICRVLDNCSQCWDTCEMLQRSRTACTRRECGLGCQEACRYAWLSPSQKPPVQVTQHEAALTVTDSRVSWPTTPPAVYLVTGQPGSPLWQTLEASISLPPGRDPTTVRVLVVDRWGLSKVLSPAPQSLLYIIIRSLGLEERMGLGQQTRQRIQDPNSTKHLSSVAQKDTTRDPWRLRVVSLIQQSSLVLAQIIWESQQLETESQQMYLVTWLVDEGNILGNLFTNSSGVTLSLWPDAIYMIQVSLFSLESDGPQSEPLVLDTHRVTQRHLETNSQSDTKETDTHGQTNTERTNSRRQTGTQMTDHDVYWLSWAAFLIFLLVYTVVYYKWHYFITVPIAGKELRKNNASKQMKETKLTIVPRRGWTKKPHAELTTLPTPVPYVFFGYTQKEYRNKPSPGPRPDSQACMEELAFILRGDTYKRPDIRYNFMLGPDGIVYEGRGWKKIPRLPTKYFNLNLQSLYITFIGDYSAEPPAESIFKLRQDFFKYGVQNHFIDKNFTLFSLANQYNLHKLSLTY